MIIVPEQSTSVLNDALNNVLTFLEAHTYGTANKLTDVQDVQGDFGLYANPVDYDLYGMIDAAYVLYTVGLLPERTSRASRAEWARRILDCQDGDGWFSRRNLRGHSREHATAYAIGALRLLEVEPDEDYVSQLKPLLAIKPLLSNRTQLERWLSVLDFRLSPRSILQKKLGWHYIWRGSHVGGGIPAAVGMAGRVVEAWWPGEVNVEKWFGWYFDWLNTHASATTGYWQRAAWNLLYRKPTLIDMAGAVHFFWLYDALRRPFPYPEAVVASTLALQRENGLYKSHPFCIDLDGNFCLIRSYLQLSPAQQATFRQQVYESAERSFEAVAQVLSGKPLTGVYKDSHGLPGALASLVECTKLPEFKYTDMVMGWQHPLDKVWWL